MYFIGSIYGEFMVKLTACCVRPQRGSMFLSLILFSVIIQFEMTLFMLSVEMENVDLVESLIFHNGTRPV